MIREDFPSAAAFESQASTVHRSASPMKIGGKPLDIDFLTVHWQN
jgi:hypothetical protein